MIETFWIKGEPGGEKKPKKLDATFEILNCVYITFKAKELVELECCHGKMKDLKNVWIPQSNWSA